MNNELHYEVNISDVIKQQSLTAVHLHIDTDNHTYYYEYFKNICRQMKMLVALGEMDKARELCEKEKRDLAVAIQLKAKIGLEVILNIPMLDVCCELFIPDKD